MCGYSSPLSEEAIEAIEADPENPMNYCCAGAAMNGPRGCTCWRACYDRPRRKPRPGKLGVRDTQCVDCAYRGGSAEMRDEDERSRLLSLAASGLDPDGPGRGVFLCHQGMAHVVRWRHPRGMVIEAGRDEVGAINTWAPRYSDAVTAHKANGAPADICAGYTMHAARLAGVA